MKNTVVSTSKSPLLPAERPLPVSGFPWNLVPMGRWLLALAATLAFLSACGNFYRAEVQGYLRDSENDGGINGATVYFYQNAPDSAGEDGWFAKTSTADFNGNPGYYTSRVYWQSFISEFGPEGDSGELHLGITHPDYADEILLITGVFSDSTNNLEDILLTRTTFRSPSVSGRVVNAAGEGVNGVRLVLDLSSTPDDGEDYVAFTGTVDGEPGRFEFDDVTWSDENASDSSSESVTISVDDNEWESAQTRTLTLSSDEESDVSPDIPVARIPRTNFQLTVRGVIEDRTAEGSIIPFEGIFVQLEYVDPDGTQTVTDFSGANGAYEFVIQWDEAAAVDESSITINRIDFDMNSDGTLAGGAPDGAFDWSGSGGREVSSLSGLHNLPRFDPNP